MCHLTLFKGHEVVHSTNTRVIWMNYVPQLLEMISVLHVTLLVTFRFVAIMRPTSYRQIHKKMKNYSVVFIWVFSIFIQCINNVLLIYHLEAGQVLHLFIISTFYVLPVIGIMSMHIITISKLKTKKSSAEQKFGIVPNPDGKTIEDEMIFIVQKLGVILIVCYVPFLVQRLYYYLVVFKRFDGKLLLEEVSLLLRIKVHYSRYVFSIRK